MLIALTGYKGSGKDVCADYLVANYGFVKMSFAEPLKEVLKVLFMFDDEQLYGSQIQKEEPDLRWFGCSARTSMQFIGTEVLRDSLEKIMPGIGSDYFVKRLGIWFEAEIAKNPNIKVVVSDLRFLNEDKYIKKMAGMVIRINRKSVILTDLHQSETEFEKIIPDYIFSNDESVENLYNKLDTIIK
jgi:dephospho-CoA kinase